MEWAWLAVWCAASAVAGALLLLAAQAALLAWYVGGAPQPPPEPEDCPLPEELRDMGTQLEAGGDCAAAVSLALQFLFQELQHAPAPLAWLHRRLHQEMADLLARSTSGKLFDSLTVRSVAAGVAAPRVRWAGVQRAECGAGGRLRTLDLLLDLHYTGGFRLAVDAGLLLGKTACLDIQVEELSGRARIRFSREPYTHWSLSFLSPPRLQLRSRPLRGRLAALLQAHARRALQRRHTLPNYTIRYKPFFTKMDPAQLDVPGEDPSIKLQGNLEITLIEITRLFTELWLSTKAQNHRVHCTMSLDSSPWISHRQDEEYSTFTLDIVINKDRNQQLGTVFKQINSVDEKYGKTSVVIETVVPLSAAYKADLRRGDTLIAVDSKIVTNMSQIAKIVKGISRPCFTVRIERKVKKTGNEDGRSVKKEEATRQDTLSVGDGEDPVVPRRGKSNSFSFRKMSEVLESARNVGQEGRALLRGAQSNHNIQDQDSKLTHSTNDQTDTLEPSNSSTPSKSQTKVDDCASPTKSSMTPSNIISFSKHTDSIQMTFGFGLRKRRCSVENRTSSDSSNSSTPTASSPGTPSKKTDKAASKDQNTTKTSGEDNGKDLPKSRVHLDSQGSISLSDGPKETDKVSHNEYSNKTCSDDYYDQASNPKISVMNVENNSESKSKGDINEFADFLQTHTTNCLPLCELLEYSNKCTFKLNRNHRYLNLNIWGKADGKEEVLLAYLNIPLQSVLKECKTSKIGQHTKKFTLLPPEVNLTVSKTHPLSAHSGFEPCLCYGDILFSFIWSNQPPASSDSKLTKEPSQDNKSTHESEGDYITDYEVLDALGVEEEPAKPTIPWKAHDFLRTHFHRSTQCDFCGKKIWLKDAVQCRDCALCCHKKCVVKCLSSGRCQPPQDGGLSPSEAPSSGSSTMPEFLMTEHMDSPEDLPLTPAASQEYLLRESTSTKSDDGLLGRAALAGLLGGLRRVGSAHSLVPPGPPPPTARSLPPSPHHTPRRHSPDEDAAWTALEGVAVAGAVSAADLLRPLLDAQLPPDLLLASARDRGPRLLAQLAPEPRVLQLSTMITDVRVALDEESTKISEHHSSLRNRTMNTHERTKLMQTLQESEERSLALTALLLHCCAAMQSANRNSSSE